MNAIGARLRPGLAPVALAALLGLYLTAPAVAHGSGGAAGNSTVRVDLRDIEVTDQDGAKVMFASQAVGDSIVVVDFVYTTCTTVCPVLSTVMGQVYRALRERGDDAVRLISISVDAGTDTPERLRETADKFGAGPGWMWLTGYKPDVDRVIDGLKAYTADYADHPSLVMVGDGAGGGWTRFFGFPSPEQILHRVDDLLAARSKATTLSQLED